MSNCILKLESVFENRDEFYLVYEDADMIMKDSSSDEISGSFLTKMMIEIIIGISEINSLGLRIMDLNKSNIAVSKKGDFKLFNFIEVQRDLKRTASLFTKAEKNSVYPPCILKQARKKNSSSGKGEGILVAELFL